MARTRILRSLVATVLFASAFAGVANAFPANMKIAGRANPPIGAYEFCNSDPSNCTGSHADTGPSVLTEDAWKTILKVNYQVNSAVQPMTDQDIYGVEEKWAYPTTVGDCEDFALLKQRLLIKAGFAPADVLMTVVLQPNGDGHAVLTVRTDRGDFILDNMRTKVLLWSETEYKFLKRQSATSEVAWDKIQDGRTAYVGSLSQ